MRKDDKLTVSTSEQWSAISWKCSLVPRAELTLVVFIKFAEYRSKFEAPAYNQLAKQEIAYLLVDQEFSKTFPSPSTYRPIVSLRSHIACKIS